MELRDARLGHAEHLADLAQGQILVVVERDHELLALGQARDRVARPSRGARSGRTPVCGSGPCSSSIVSISATWSPPEPEIVHSSSSAAIDDREMSVRLSSSSSTLIADLRRDLLVGRRAPELRLELGHGALDLARPRADRARDPVESAQLVEDRALDPRDRVRLELHVAVRLVPLDRGDQAEQPVRDEVAVVDVRGQSAAEPAGDVLDERRVGEDQPVADRLVVRALERPPELVDVLGHLNRIRREARFSSTARAPEHPEPCVAEPDSDCERSRCDHPRAAAGARRCVGDAEQTDARKRKRIPSATRARLLGDQGYNPCR